MSPSPQCRLRIRVSSCRAILSYLRWSCTTRRSYQLLSLVLSYALLLQIMPARSVAAANYRSTNRTIRTDAKSKPVSKLEEGHASVEGATLTTSGATPDPQNSANLSTITDAVISRQRPNLN